MLLTGCVNSERDKEIREISGQYRVPEDKQLVLYTSHKEEVYLPIVREFEERTGIWVDVHAGGTTQLFDEIRNRRENAGCDVMFGGGIASYEAAGDLFLPYFSAEKDKINENWSCPEGTWTPFTELPIVFVYNNKLLSEQEAPVSWEEILSDPRFRGQIAFADPSNSGTGYTVLATLLQLTDEADEQIISKFCDQLSGKVLEGSGEVIPAVADGEYLTGITLEETAIQYMAQNSDISICYPAEGTSAIPDGCAIVKGAPHSYNAGLFIDFVTGRDTQKYAVEYFGRRSIRTDVRSDDREDFKVLNLDLKQAAKQEKEIMEIWKKEKG